MAEYANYAITQYKAQEQSDDGFMGSASPTSEPTTSPLGNTQRLAGKAIGAYAGIKVYSNVTSNIKNLTGSTALQAKVDAGTFIIGSIGAAFATKGLSIVYQTIDMGIDYAIRGQINQIENQARQEERKFLGKHITNSMGVAYYD